MSDIVTITINPAVDIFVNIGRVEPTRKMRTSAPKRDPGGGGINVARVAFRLDARVTAIYPASGAIGRFLLPRLLRAEHDVIAISREPRASGNARLRWIAGGLPDRMPSLPPAATIFSLGPLDAFAGWLAAHGSRDALA